MPDELSLSLKIKNLFTLKFVRNFATLSVGSAGGAVIQALAGVVLARLLQPELFGVYALAFGLASISSLFLSTGTSEAVTTIVADYYTQKNKERISEALAFLLKITLITGAFALIFALIAPALSQRLYNTSSIGVYAQPVILASIISALFFSTTSLALQVGGRIKALSGLVLADFSVRFSASIILVLVGGGVYGAMAGHLAGALIIFLAAVIIWLNVIQKDQLFPTLKSLLSTITTTSLKRYLRFSVWVAVDRNIANLYSALPLVIAGIFISNQEVSYFKLAFGYINLALVLLGPVSTLLNVEFPKINVENSKRLRQSFLKVSLFGAGLSTALTLGALIIAPFIFSILYGQSYQPSIPYVYGLVIYGAAYGLGVGLGSMWRTLKLVNVSILINIIVLGLGIPAGFWLLSNYGSWGAIIMVTLWYTASHVASFVYLLYRTGRVESNN